MTPERSQQIEELFHATLEQEPGKRRAFLTEACDGDASLRAEVEVLVAALEDAPDFLEEPLSGALSQAATRIEDEAKRLEEDGRSLAGERVGAWELTKKISAGGMGAVYLARRADGHYEKEVAIKLIRRGIGADDPVQRSKMIRSFRDELQHHANLDHPNVAKLFDGGTTADGLPYLVMEYVEGQPIDKYCEAHEMSIRERLRLFRTVCLAVQHAHNRFVAHCDIKPTNILVAQDPESEGEPAPKLLDFGIAKLLKRGDHGTAQAAKTTWMRAMTPQYASPEQVQGGLITAASDVYSLGVVLYELVTGRLPYSVTEYDAKQVICEQIPKKPSLIKQTVNREVDMIVLKALEKDPAHRYSGPAALAEDIERHLTGRPILARGDNPLYQFSKFLNRHRSRIASVLFLIAAGIAIGVWIESTSKETERRYAGVERENTMLLLGSVGRRLHADAVSLEAESKRRDAELKFTDAAACFRRVLEMEENAPAGSEPRSESLSAEIEGLLGHCLLELRRYEQAEKLLLRSHSVIHEHFGDQDRRTQETRGWIVELYEAWGKPDKAAEWRSTGN